MRKTALFLFSILALAACTKDIEPEVKAAVNKQFGAKEALIFLVEAKDKDAGHCGMFGHPATEAEPFERPKPFLYKDGRFLMMTSAEPEKQRFLDQCLGKVPVLVPEMPKEGQVPLPVPK